MVPAFVRKAIEDNVGIAHHRHPEYHRVDKEVRAGLCDLFGAGDGAALIFRGGGRTMMEAVITNLGTKELPVCVINTGKFADEWMAIASRYSVPAHEIKIEWGRMLDHDSLARYFQVLGKRPDMLLMQAADTSTGVKNSWASASAFIKDWSPQTLLALDAVLEGGVSKINMDKDGVDILLGAGQKAFTLPPGLGYAILSKRALWYLAQTRPYFPTSEFSFRNELESLKNNETRFTPPVEHVIGLHRVLRYIHDVDESNWYFGHCARANFVRGYLKEHAGIELFTKQSPTNAVSVFSLPPKLDAVLVQEKLREAGFVVETGQGTLKHSVIRVAHFHGIGPFEIIKDFCREFVKICLA